MPSQHTIFAQAAEALRQGFFAAHKASGSTAGLQVIEIDDEPDQLRSALLAARDRGVRVAVGPLPRVEVNAVVEGRAAVLPLVALNFPDWEAGVPATMVAMGLSAEVEAQRVVRVALSEFVGLTRSTTPRFMVLAGASPLERRIAAAYVAALRAASEVPTVIDVSPETLEDLAARFATGRYEAVFLALGARDAALVRSRIPRPLLIFATSLVNAGSTGSTPGALVANELDGVRLVDMPWLLAVDHPAVMTYPQPVEPLPVELARLYALGIDAYRVAVLWMSGRTQFELDGVTGHLRVDRARGPRVERTPMSAIYRNGALEREDVAR